MPKPNYPVKQICYADDISVWASGAKIPELEVKINDYLKEMSECLKSNSLLISAPKSTVTLFTPDTKQAKSHPDIKIAGSQLPLNRSPKILGVHLDTSLTFKVHCTQAATRVSNRNNVLKALAGTTWGQQKETIQGNRKVGRQLRCPSLECQCKRHQHRKDSDCAERSPENTYRISQDADSEATLRSSVCTIPGSVPGPRPRMPQHHYHDR